jgi:hypothetical protein
VGHHVVASGHEVLGATADGGLVDDHQAHLVGHVEHVRAGRFHVDAYHVVVEALVVVHRLGPAAVAGRWWQEAGQGVVRVALPAVVDPVVVGALQAVATEVHPHAVEVVVLAVLRALPEPEAVRGITGAAVVSGGVYR